MQTNYNPKTKNASSLHTLQLYVTYEFMLKYLVNQYGSKSSFAALFHIKLPQFLSKSNNRIPLSTAYKSLAKILNVDLSSIIYRVLQICSQYLVVLSIQVAEVHHD